MIHFTYQHYLTFKLHCDTMTLQGAHFFIIDIFILRLIYFRALKL